MERGREGEEKVPEPGMPETPIRRRWEGGRWV